MPEDQAFVEDVIRAMVRRPEEVSTVRTTDERGVLITLSCHPEDMGYVIGKEGRNAVAVRTLLRVVGAKSNLRVSLVLNEPNGGRKYGKPMTAEDVNGITF